MDALGAAKYRGATAGAQRYVGAILRTRCVRASTTQFCISQMHAMHQAGVGRYAGSFDAERDMAMTTRCGWWATVMAVAMAVTIPAGAATLPAGAAK